MAKAKGTSATKAKATKPGAKTATRTKSAVMKSTAAKTAGAKPTSKGSAAKSAAAKSAGGEPTAKTAGAKPRATGSAADTKSRGAAIKKVARSKPGAGAPADLLRAILDHPDDDRARLVYADALQEAGDPRGEFIALSLAEGKEAAKRAKELLDAHRQKSWQNFGAKGARFTWDRGFVHEVGCKARELAAAGPLMFEVEPIQSLAIYGYGDGQMAKILRFPLRISRLSLGVEPEDSEALAKAKTLGNVTWLQLSGFGNRSAKILGPSKAMPKLEYFSASLGNLNAEGMAALANGPLLANVRRLYLNQHDLDAEAIEILTSAPWASQLTTLALSQNPVGDAGVAALASGKLSSLRTLYLANDWRRQGEPALGAGAADALVAAATTTFENLEELDLSWNITGEPLERVRGAYGKRLTMRVERFD